MVVKKYQAVKRHVLGSFLMLCLGFGLIASSGRPAAASEQKAVAEQVVVTEAGEGTDQSAVTDRSEGTDQSAVTEQSESTDQPAANDRSEGTDQPAANDPTEPDGEREAPTDGEPGDQVPPQFHDQWVEQNGLFYYYDSEGQLLVSQWVGERYVKTDGSRATNEELLIEGSYYRFDAQGQRLQMVKQDGYFYSRDGRRVSRSWQKDPQTEIWNWFGEDGRQVTKGWIHDGKAWYYIEENGDYARSRWQGSYYLSESGRMAQSAWIDDKQYQAWYYVGSDGAYLHGRELFDRGYWFYLKTDGRMASNEEVKGFRYDRIGRRLINRWYRNQTGKYWRWYGEDGHIVYSRWIHDGKDWYYIEENGDYARSRWQGEYYLLQNGRMAELTWIWDDDYQAWYYLRADGSYARAEIIQYGKDLYYLLADGKMAREHWQWDEATKKWYWFTQSGRYDTETKRRPMGTGQKVIFFDPGHGGNDPGAIYGDLVEKELALSVYRSTKAKLEAAGYTVLSSREDDRYVDFVTERSRLANETNADLFISLHFNAGGGKGIETYYYAGGYGAAPRINQTYHEDKDRLFFSKRLAHALQSAVIAASGANSRSVKDANFAVLRETELPAVLIELGFLDNAAEAQKIREASYREKLAEGLYKGILNYYSMLPK